MPPFTLVYSPIGSCNSTLTFPLILFELTFAFVAVRQILYTFTVPEIYGNGIILIIPVIQEGNIRFFDCCNISELHIPIIHET